MEAISSWLVGMGIDPLLGGLVLGALLILLLRRGGRSDRSGVRLDLTMGSDSGLRAAGPALRTGVTRRETTSMELDVNGQRLAIPDAVSAEILTHLRQGHKIEAIKRLREATGLGLAEA